MKRFRKIQKEAVNTPVESNVNHNGNGDKKADKTGNVNGNGEQVLEEKAAATLFPLNLISSKFRSANPNVLKGKVSLWIVVRT